MLIEQRSCDICYLRQKSSNLIERKLNLLNIKDKSIRELEKKHETLTKQLENTSSEIKEIAQNVNLYRKSLKIKGFI